MTKEEFETLKQEPTTCDILKWIIREFIDSGVQKRTMMQMVREVYKEAKKD